MICSSPLVRQMTRLEDFLYTGSLDANVYVTKKSHELARGFDVFMCIARDNSRSLLPPSRGCRSQVGQINTELSQSRASMGSSVSLEHSERCTSKAKGSYPSK